MEKENKTQNENAGQTERRPYVKPACTSEAIFETTALACGKISGQGGACNSVPSAS